MNKIPVDAVRVGDEIIFTGGTRIKVQSIHRHADGWIALRPQDTVAGYSFFVKVGEDMVELLNA